MRAYIRLAAAFPLLRAKCTRSWHATDGRRDGFLAATPMSVTAVITRLRAITMTLFLYIETIDCISAVPAP